MSVVIHNSDMFHDIGIEWLDTTGLVEAPMQQRSRDTMLKILWAAKNLFVEKGYQETSMSEIGKVAGMSMGSIYHRFSDKKSIFYAILEMFRYSRYAKIDELAESRDWSQSVAEDVLALHIEIMFSSTRQDFGFMRLIERERIVDSVVCQHLIEWNGHLVDVITDLMRPHEKRIHHDDLHEAITTTHGILRGAVVWSILPLCGQSSIMDVYSEKFKASAYDMAAAYLGLK